jgi:hypothetical protein
MPACRCVTLEIGASHRGLRLTLAGDNTAPSGSSVKFVGYASRTLPV